MNENLIVSLKDIVVDFDGQKVLDGLSLDIHDKEFVTFLGPSGCGKTTTLRVIAGFITPKSGNVFFDGKDIADLPPYKRQVNTVFQKYALFPHLNVFENVAFGLRLKKLPEEVKQIYEKRLNTINRYVKRGALDADLAEVMKKLAKDKMLRALGNVAYAKGDYEKEMGQAALKKEAIKRI